MQNSPFFAQVDSVVVQLLTGVVTLVGGASVVMLDAEVLFPALIGLGSTLVELVVTFLVSLVAAGLVAGTDASVAFMAAGTSVEALADDGTAVVVVKFSEFPASFYLESEWN